MPRFARYALFGLLCLVLGSALAQTARARQFVLPGHGQLQLLVPDAWHADVHQPPGQLPPTVMLSPAGGAPFQVLVTPIWPLRAGATLPDLASILDEVAAAAKALAPQSVEKVLKVESLGDAGNPGYYFAATDSAPKPGEFKYLTQGIARVGDINLAFTVLTNDGQDAVVKVALDMLRRASQARNGVRERAG